MAQTTGDPWNLPFPSLDDVPDIPKDMETLARSVHAKLTSVQDSAANARAVLLANVTSQVQGRVSKSGDQMTGPLYLPELRVSARFSVSFWNNKFNLIRMSPNGTVVESTVFSSDVNTGAFTLDVPRSPGGTETAPPTGVVVQLGSGQLKTFDRTSLSLWSAGGVASTRRLKHGISPARDLDGVLAIEPVTFRYAQGVSADDDLVHLGVVAEQVADVFPQGVIHDEDGQPEMVDVLALVTGLISEVASLKERVADLESRVH